MGAVRPKSEKLDKVVISQNRMRPNRRTASLRERLAGRETTRVTRAVRMWAGDKDRTLFPPWWWDRSRVFGHVTQRREHERCVLYMPLDPPIIKAPLEAGSPAAP